MRTIRLLLAAVMLLIPAVSFAQIGISVRIGPPELPVYEQPICPGDGYLWTPGYWDWDPDVSDYYWVPGLWVMAPEAGFLWTPGYWGWGGSGFVFTEGYWGPTVGFYGGINYGFGYFGTGFEGGRWQDGHFFYNRAVLNVNVTNIHNVYNTTVVHNDTTRVSFNGGQGGTTARPTEAEQAAARDRHVGPVAEQTQHVQTARSDPQARNSVNHGRPAAAALNGRQDTARPGGEQPREPGADAGRAAGARGSDARAVSHAKDLGPINRPAPVNSGDPKADQKYQKQMDKLVDKQNKEQQKLQAQQDKEHQKKLNDADHQQMEQRHQQQAQSLQQRQSSEMQSMQQRAPAPRPAPAGRPR